MAEYAGDVECSAAWEMLCANEQSLLVDVRTAPELAFVGVPDLNRLGKQVICVEWQHYPSMSLNTSFVEELLDSSGIAHGDAHQEILFLCRSGVRSQSAAQAVTRAGFERCYNVLGGFEGRHNEKGQRGLFEGWKFEGLPWRQG